MSKKIEGTPDLTDILQKVNYKPENITHGMDTRPSKPKSLKATLHYKGGTSVELHEGSGYGSHSTVYVDEKGWRTTSWWSSFGLAKAMFENDVERAKKEGRYDRED